MERVFPDTNVLYPISLADLILRLDDIGLHQVLWSEDLLAEVERVLVERKSLAPEQSAYFCDCIREAFPEGEVHREDYADLIASRTGPDPDDHVHSAAAVAGGATVRLSSDRSGFPRRDLGQVRRISPDNYFAAMLDEHPDEVLMVLDEMGSTRRYPQTVEATLRALNAAGLGQFAAKVSRRLRR